MEAERTPLLSGGPSAPRSITPPPPYSDIRRDLESINHDEGSSMFDSGSGPSFIRCEVCSHRIDPVTSKNKRIVECLRCNEFTAIGPAEKGKKFLRCPECNCLCVVNEKNSKSTCPRNGCKCVIDVKTGKPVRPRGLSDPMHSQDPIPTPQYRIICGYCHGTFVQDVLPTNNRINCPLCNRKSYIGDAYVKRLAMLYFCGGLGCIIICIALMATTMGLRHNAGYWYIYLILMIISVILIVKGLWYLCMKHSQLELMQAVA